MTHEIDQLTQRFEAVIGLNRELLKDYDGVRTRRQRRNERMRRLMRLLKNPHFQVPYIHVGGTSGKGSVSMLCESILNAAGFKTGAYTNPYLQTPVEKLRVAGRLIDPKTAVRLGNIVADATDTITEKYGGYLGSPVYAETWSALAFLLFAEESCDAGIIEVGMGGRYDSTNGIVPMVSVINTIHYDHLNALGGTLESIAHHKAGIIKTGIPLVLSVSDPAIVPIFEQEAMNHGSRFFRLGQHFRSETLSVDTRGGRFHYKGINRDLDDLSIKLRGGHQIFNATTALAAIEVYADMMDVQISEDAIRQGLQDARFAGRLEVVQDQPQVVLDGAHNEQKIGALIAALPKIFTYRRLIVVLGMLSSKPSPTTFDMLTQIADVIVTTEQHVIGKATLASDELADGLSEHNGCQVITGGEPTDALDLALEQTGPDDLLLVTGSLFLIGALRGRWYPKEKILSQQTTFPE